MARPPDTALQVGARGHARRLVGAGITGLYLLWFEQSLTRIERAKAAKAGVLRPSPAQEAAIALNGVYFRTAGTSNFASLFDFLQYAPSEFRAIAEENHLVSEIIGGKAYISGHFIGAEGALLQMERNEWRVGSAAWDRNYNDHALEVVDENHTVVLQFRFVGGTPRFQGRVCARNGEKLWIKDGARESAEMYVTTNQGIPCVIGNQREQFSPDGKIEFVPCAPYTNCFYIRPLFRYPSDLHFGELADAKR